MDFGKIKDKATEAINKLDPATKEQIIEKGKEAVETVKNKVAKN